MLKDMYIYSFRDGIKAIFLKGSKRNHTKLGLGESFSAEIETLHNVRYVIFRKLNITYNRWFKLIKT